MSGSNGERGGAGEARSSGAFFKGAACLVFSAFKAFFRNIVAVFVTLFVLLSGRAKNKSQGQERGPLLPKGSLKFLILRGLCGSAGIFGNFYALDRIPIADAAILNKMSPFFAVVFSLFLLGEKIAPLPLVATIGAFLGALLER